MASSSESLGIQSNRSSTRDGEFSEGGRRYLVDAGTVGSYPLPIDLAETHRQIMFTQLGLMVFGAPFLSPDLLENPPRRVLDLGCNTGFWSVLCHQYFQERGHRVSFVGIDIKAPPDVDECYRALGMDWQYIQHDLSETPWPVADESFDVVMAKDLALALNGRAYSNVVLEYVRALKPGGTLEIWEHDFILRNLQPKIQDAPVLDTPAGARLGLMGVYPADNNSLLRPSTNRYAIEYNTWITAGLAARELPVAPCSFVTAMLGGHLVEGVEKLGGMLTRRIAVPLGPVSWERERGDGCGGGGDGDGEDRPRVLSDEQRAIRQATLETFVGMVEAFEPILRDASGKDQGAWDTWATKAKKDWLQDGGFALGEFLELAAWSMKKEEDEGESSEE